MAFFGVPKQLRSPYPPQPSPLVLRLDSSDCCDFWRACAAGWLSRLCVGNAMHIAHVYQWNPMDMAMEPKVPRILLRAQQGLPFRWLTLARRYACEGCFLQRCTHFGPAFAPQKHHQLKHPAVWTTGLHVPFLVVECRARNKIFMALLMSLPKLMNVLLILLLLLILYSRTPSRQCFPGGSRGLSTREVSSSVLV